MRKPRSKEGQAGQARPPHPGPRPRAPAPPRMSLLPQRLKPDDQVHAIHTPDGLEMGGGESPCACDSVPPRGII